MRYFSSFLMSFKFILYKRGDEYISFLKSIGVMFDKQRYKAGTL